MSKIVALVPARSGSKGIADKNILTVDGTPLLGLAIKAAQAASLISNVYLSTDSPEYAEIGISYGASVPCLRKSGFSDHSRDLDVLKDFIINFDGTAEFIVYLRPTSPDRTPEMIDQAILQFRASQPFFDSLRSVVIFPHTGFKTATINSTGALCCLYNPDLSADSYTSWQIPRQELPTLYKTDGRVDILSSAAIKRDFLYGEKCMPFIINRPLIDIDSYEDFSIFKSNAC